MVAPAGAQETADADSDCPGAKVVNTTNGSGNKQSPVFSITGDSFRVTTALEATSDPELLFFSVDVNKEGGENVTTIDRESPGTDSSIVNAGPGRFFLDILAANVDYTVTVEDCTGSAGGQGDTPADDQYNDGGGGSNDGGGDMSNDDGGGDVDNPNDVIDDTTSKKPLPNTGGVPLLGLAVGALAFVGIGFSVLRASIRRDW